MCYSKCKEIIPYQSLIEEIYEDDEEDEIDIEVIEDEPDYTTDEKLRNEIIKRLSFYELYFPLRFKSFFLRLNDARVLFQTNPEFFMLNDKVLNYLNIEKSFFDDLNHVEIWNYISDLDNLTEDFIKKYKFVINWEFVSKNIKLSENFIKEFKDEVYWPNISKYQNLSREFIIEFKDYIDWLSFPKENITLEFYEFYKDYENNPLKFLILKLFVNKDNGLSSALIPDDIGYDLIKEKYHLF